MGSTAPPLHPSDPRVPLALERTFLAWIRTSLALMAFGLVVARFALVSSDPELGLVAGKEPPRAASILAGTGLVALGAFTAAFSAARFRRDLRELAAGLAPMRARSARMATLLGAALAGIGLLSVVYFAATWARPG
jgi:putative membrane protein